MLMLVRHMLSGELYVVRQDADGHAQEITGPYYEPDYHVVDLWALSTLALHHVTSADRGEDDLEWADAQMFLNVADLSPWERVIH